MARKKRVHVEEYIPEAPLASPLETILEHTEYSVNRSARHSTLTIQNTDRTLSTSTQDASPANVGQVAEFTDGDLEIAEMMNCELEAHGLTKYMQADEGDVIHAEKRRRTQSVC